MPSNRELREEAAALGDELGVAVETTGLSNAKLQDLVSGLKARKLAPAEEAAAETPASEMAPDPEVEQSFTREEPPSPPSKEPPAERDKKEPKGPTSSAGRLPRYVVKPGKSLSCGSVGLVLRPGDEVKPRYFSDGDRSIERLVDSGHVELK